MKASTPGPSTPELLLARLAAGGDRAAFGELARRHAGSVRVMLRRMGAQAALADDLAQDALVLAFQNIGGFRGEGGFAAWTRRIAARLYLKRLKGRLRLETPLADMEDAAGGGEGAAAPSLDLAMDLDRALATLSEAERVCVTLCHAGGFTHAEIAESLGAPLGTVKSHVRRGLAKLRERMLAPARTEARA